eukprot:GSA120T00012264001.1
MEQETQHLGGTHSQPAEEEQVQRQFQQQASTHDQVRTENTEDPMQQQLQHPTHQQRQALQRQEQPERHLQLLRGKQEEAHRRRRKNRLRSSEPSFHSRGTSRQQQRATHVSAPSSSRPSSIDGGATSAEVSGPSDFTTSAWSLDVAPSAGKPSREESGLYRTFANQLLPCVNDIISDKANSTTARSGTSNERTQKNGAPYVSEDALAAVFRAAFTGVVPIASSNRRRNNPSNSFLARSKIVRATRSCPPEENLCSSAATYPSSPMPRRLWNRTRLSQIVIQFLSGHPCPGRSAARNIFIFMNTCFPHGKRLALLSVFLGTPLNCVQMNVLKGSVDSRPLLRFINTENYVESTRVTLSRVDHDLFFSFGPKFDTPWRIFPEREYNMSFKQQRSIYRLRKWCKGLLGSKCNALPIFFSLTSLTKFSTYIYSFFS